MHVHVKRDRRIAKFWLIPVVLARNQGFAQHELNQVEQLVEKHVDTLREAWYNYFGA